jgi:hypothetical protein
MSTLVKVDVLYPAKRQQNIIAVAAMAASKVKNGEALMVSRVAKESVGR